MADAFQPPAVTANGILPTDEASTEICTRLRRGGWITFPLVTASVMGLTVAAAGWMANLIVYLIQQFNIKSIDAAQIYGVVNGFTSLFPIAGAVIADSFMGNFSVIIISSLISLLDMILFMLTGMIDYLRPPNRSNSSSSAVSVCESPTSIQFTVLYAAIALASIGLGGTRFTNATMGANQFNEPNSQGVFFNWYFFTLYFASIISFTGVVYVQDNVSWSWGFGLCTAANAVGLVVFLLGKKYYRHVKPQGSPFTSMARVVVASFVKRKMNLSTERKDYYYELQQLLGDALGQPGPGVHSAPTASFR
ncbi:hypothetical protein Sjap_013148 [Stephania japonica]|uniref:Uncharacterized protein n=1 Tax=Stephania japonica TaxID=461633 RepID=A0AAP0IXE2_9MAGN